MAGIEVSNLPGARVGDFYAFSLNRSVFSNSLINRISGGKRIHEAATDPAGFQLSAARNIKNVGLNEGNFSWASFTSTATAKSKAAAMAHSSNQSISFWQASRMVEERMPGQAARFYDAVTSIGVDSPNDLGAFLTAFNAGGVGMNGGTGGNTANLIYAAQHVAEKAPGALSSFLQGLGNLTFKSVDLQENYLGRAVQVAEQFGSDMTRMFSRAFGITPKTELMDEFFAASDAVMAHGAATYEKFLSNITDNAHLAHGYPFQVGTYLEYVTGLANSGDTVKLNQFLNNPISGNLFTPTFNAGGISTAVTGIDVTFQADAREFGATNSDSLGFGAADSYTRRNTAGVSLSADAFGVGRAFSAVYQTFDVVSGNHVSGDQTADVTVNLNYDVRYETVNPLDIVSTIAAPISAGSAAAKAAAKEAAEKGIEITARELAKAALKAGAKQAVSDLGEAAVTDIAENAIASQTGNLDGNVTVMAYLVEKDAEGNSTVVGDPVEVATLDVDTNMIGLPVSDQRFGMNTDITFENVRLKEGYEYSVVLAVQGSVGSVDGDFTNVSGHVQMNSITVDFADDMNVGEVASYDQVSVPTHGTYDGQEVARVLKERRTDDLVQNVDALMNQYNNNLHQLRGRLDQITSAAQDAEARTLAAMQIRQQAAVSMLGAYNADNPAFNTGILNLLR